MSPALGCFHRGGLAQPLTDSFTPPSRTTGFPTNLFPRCVSQFRVSSVNALFDTLYAMCNLLMMPAENLRGAMQGDQGRNSIENLEFGRILFWANFWAIFCAGSMDSSSSTIQSSPLVVTPSGMTKTVTVTGVILYSNEFHLGEKLDCL